MSQARLTPKQKKFQNNSPEAIADLQAEIASIENLKYTNENQYSVFNELEYYTNALYKAIYLEEIVSILKEMRLKHLTPDQYFLNTLIFEIGSAKLIDESYRLFQWGIKQNLVKVETFKNMLRVIIQSVQNYPEMAQEVFGAFKKFIINADPRIPPHEFTIVANMTLRALLKSKFLRAKQFFEEMVESKIADTISFIILIEKLGVNAKSKKEEIVNLFNRCCANPHNNSNDPDLYASVIKALKDADAAQEFYDMAVTRKIRMSESIYANTIFVLANAPEPPIDKLITLCENMLADFKKNKITVRHIIQDALIKALEGMAKKLDKTNTKLNDEQITKIKYIFDIAFTPRLINMYCYPVLFNVLSYSESSDAQQYVIDSCYRASENMPPSVYLTAIQFFANKNHADSEKNAFEILEIAQQKEKDHISLYTVMVNLIAKNAGDNANFHQILLGFVKKVCARMDKAEVIDMEYINKIKRKELHYHKINFTTDFAAEADKKTKEKIAFADFCNAICEVFDRKESPTDQEKNVFKQICLSIFENLLKKPHLTAKEVSAVARLLQTAKKQCLVPNLTHEASYYISSLPYALIYFWLKHELLKLSEKKEKFRFQLQFDKNDFASLEIAVQRIKDELKHVLSFEVQKISENEVAITLLQKQNKIVQHSRPKKAPQAATTHLPPNYNAIHNPSSRAFHASSGYGQATNLRQHHVNFFNPSQPHHHNSNAPQVVVSQNMVYPVAPNSTSYQAANYVNPQHAYSYQQPNYVNPQHAYSYQQPNYVNPHYGYQQVRVVSKPGHYVPVSQQMYYLSANPQLTVIPNSTSYPVKMNPAHGQMVYANHYTPTLFQPQMQQLQQQPRVASQLQQRIAPQEEVAQPVLKSSITPQV